MCYLCLSPSEQLTVSQSLLSDIFPNIYPLTSNKSAASNMQMASKKSCQTISKLMHNNAYTALHHYCLTLDCIFYSAPAWELEIDPNNDWDCISDVTSSHNPNIAKSHKYFYLPHSNTFWFYLRDKMSEIPSHPLKLYPLNSLLFLTRNLSCIST